MQESVTDVEPAVPSTSLTRLLPGTTSPRSLSDARVAREIAEDLAVRKERMNRGGGAVVGNQRRRRLESYSQSRGIVWPCRPASGLSAIALIVFAIISSSRAKAKRAEPKRTVKRAEPDLWERWEEADALKLELAKDGVRMAEALPVVSETATWLLHEPVYDARTDMFDAPCTQAGFEFSSGKCWETREQLPDTFRLVVDQEAPVRLGLSRPRSSVVIQAGEYLDIVKCYQKAATNQACTSRGFAVLASTYWHTYTWTCGSQLIAMVDRFLAGPSTSRKVPSSGLIGTQRFGNAGFGTAAGARRHASASTRRNRVSHGFAHRVSLVRRRRRVKEAAGSGRAAPLFVTC